MTTATPPGGAAAPARPRLGPGVSFEGRRGEPELRPPGPPRLGGEGAPRLRFQFARAAVLLDLLARALDGVLLGVEQVLDQHDQLDLAPLVDAVAGAVLRRVQEPELALPVAQHVRLQVGELADLADREELLDRMRGAHRHCSALSSRSISSATARAGGLPWNSTASTSREIGSSTPRRPPRATAARAVFTPSAALARPARAWSRRVPAARSPPG